VADSPDPSPRANVAPNPARPERAVPVATLIALLAVLLVIAVGAFYVGRARPFEPKLPPMSSSSIEVRPTPNVIVAVHDLARLETAEYHLERVIELADEQSRLFGLLRAKDALLLVAVGDVVAGVDLAKVGDADIVIDWPKRSVRIHLPAPEIFSVAIDNTRTRVVSRETDTLATRKEELEGRARSEAETSMRQAATEGGILDRAKKAGDRAVRDLLHALGFEAIEID
jgi:hypothetical protein